ncbi:hypothetical protein LB519_16070 [Mesorhizobium sp. AD1-1]|uniref:hypothetical protein n=1 Tax=Mesorhizobium sp. AD1-1 TaxID=2876621 RepID=UPI001CC91642|nr:hypothetical protein [Mesorhizobium sp. AD1-1]MBZ9719361.1 hypothetical protein [Mesorhizobium sp. AD1-1]
MRMLPERLRSRSCLRFFFLRFRHGPIGAREFDDNAQHQPCALSHFGLGFRESLVVAATITWTVGELGA